MFDVFALIALRDLVSVITLGLFLLCLTVFDFMLLMFVVGFTLTRSFVWDCLNWGLLFKVELCVGYRLSFLLIWFVMIRCLVASSWL